MVGDPCASCLLIVEENVKYLQLIYNMNNLTKWFCFWDILHSIYSQILTKWLKKNRSIKFKSTNKKIVNCRSASRDLILAIPTLWRPGSVSILLQYGYIFFFDGYFLTVAMLRTAVVTQLSIISPRAATGLQLVETLQILFFSFVSMKAGEALLPLHLPTTCH